METAVVGSLLEAIRPAGVQAAMDAMMQLDRRDDEKRKALDLSLEKARYEPISLTFVCDRLEEMGTISRAKAMLFFEQNKIMDSFKELLR